MYIYIYVCDMCIMYIYNICMWYVCIYIYTTLRRCALRLYMYINIPYEIRCKESKRARSNEQRWITTRFVPPFICFAQRWVTCLRLHSQWISDIFSLKKEGVVVIRWYEPFGSDSVGIFGKSCFQSCRGKSTTPQQRVCIVTQPGIPTCNLWRWWVTCQEMPIREDNL